MTIKIKSKDFRVQPGEKVKLGKWPTLVKPICKSKKRYQHLLEGHIEELSALQQLHYASHRYALLLIFQIGKVADPCETYLQVKEAVSTPLGRTYRGTERATTASLRVPPLCVATDFSDRKSGRPL